MDIFVVQSTVTSRRYRSHAATQSLDFARFCRQLPVPVVVGNCVAYSAALELMETGIAGLLVGVGPGAACTSREVLGIGVPQVTATMDCAAARDAYLRAHRPLRADHHRWRHAHRRRRLQGDRQRRGRGDARLAVRADRRGARPRAPLGHGDAARRLPRGTRIKVGVSGTLEQMLFGPTA